MLVFEKVTGPVAEFTPGGLVRVYPSGCCLPAMYRNYAERIHNFDVREDDVWIITFPKCGTTWTQEMVWLLTHNLDYETAKKIDITQRSPFLEGCIFPSVDKCDESSKDPIDLLEKMPSPRIFKSHLPLQLLPKQLWTKKPKIVYVARNVKDAVISYYHHFELWGGRQFSLDTFVDQFMRNLVWHCPYWESLEGFWKLRNEDHILFNTFESMKKDLLAETKKTASFLGKNYTEEQLKELCDHLSFDSMKQNSATNYSSLVSNMRKAMSLAEPEPGLSFLRKGKVGQWKEELSQDTLKKFEDWIKECKKGKDLPELEEDIK